MSDVVHRPSCYLTESRFRRCARAIAHHDRSVTGQQDEVTTGEWNRLRHAFDIEPAVAARQHGEVRQICGGIVPAGRRDFFFSLILLYQAPWGCSFESVLTESGDVHRCEDVCYWVQASPPVLDE